MGTSNLMEINQLIPSLLLNQCRITYSTYHEKFPLTTSEGTCLLSVASPNLSFKTAYNKQ